MNKAKFFALVTVLVLIVTTFVLAQDDDMGEAQPISFVTRMSADAVAPHWVYSGPLPTNDKELVELAAVTAVEVAPRWTYIGPLPGSRPSFALYPMNVEVAPQWVYNSASRETLTLAPELLSADNVAPYWAYVGPVPES